MHIKVVRTSDSYDCDQAGCSGGYAEGANIFIEGKDPIVLEPQAHCFGGTTYSDEDVMKELFKALGHTYEEEY